MAYPNLQKLNDRNAKAANNMVAEIARGVHAGNEGITAQAAAKTSLETAEEILTQLEPVDTDEEILTQLEPVDTDDGDNG